MSREAERRPAEGGVPDDGAGSSTSGTSLPAAGVSGRDWRKLWRLVLRQALRRSGERRTRVLRHPDLAELLTGPEIGYTSPGQWTGYVPPEMWGERRNDSPRRAALVAIATEAMEREQAAGLGSTAGSPEVNYELTSDCLERVAP